MRHTLHIPRVSRITALAAAAAALLSAGSAMAIENLYGGGATFPAVPYVGNGYLTPSTPSVPAGQTARLSTNAGNVVGNPFATASVSAGSVFDAYTGATANRISYCQTGSGFGKTVLNTAAGTATGNGSCKDFRVTTPATAPAGFSGANVIADFIGTDAPYGTTDYNAFLGSTLAASRVGITQIPTLAGAIGLPHATGPITNNLPLTTSQVCRIYSGLITTWNQIPGSGSTGSIKIVYRTDGSGTTFAFTSFLAAKCNGTADVPATPVPFFTPNQTFNSAVPGGVSGLYGARAIGASGNNGVVTTSRTTTDAQGYADIGEVIAQSAEYALVNNFNPTTFGGGTTQISINPLSTSGTPPFANLLAGKVLDGATINNVPGTGSATVKNCVRLVNPSATISNAYPIVAITYLAGYYGGNGSATHIQAIKDLYNRFYLTPVTSRASLPAGFAYIDGVATFRTSITGSIGSCVN